MAEMNECERCDGWFEKGQVFTVVLTDKTEWRYCKNCMKDAEKDIVEVFDE